MVNEIKQIIQNYLNAAKLCSYVVGTVVEDGIKVNEKLTIPDELIEGNLKKNLQQGDTVRLLQNNGGQQFFILEVIEDDS